MSARTARLVRLAFAGAVIVVTAAAPAAVAQDAGEGFPGTIKVSGVIDPPTPDNDANPGCTARIDFFNFKLGAYNVLFTAVPPSGTREVLRSTVTITRTSTPASQVQQSARYELNVSGLATDGPGYKLRVEVTDPDREGQGAKSKVFSFECMPPEVLGTRNTQDVGGVAVPRGGFSTGGGGPAGALPLVPMSAVAAGLAAVAGGIVVRLRRRAA